MPEVRDDAQDPFASLLTGGVRARFRMRDGGVPEANTKGAERAGRGMFKSLRRLELAAAAPVARDLTPGH